MLEFTYKDYGQPPKTMVDEVFAKTDWQRWAQKMNEQQEIARLCPEFEEGASYSGCYYSSLVKNVIPDPDPCVYVLKTETGDFYIGQTIYPERRIIEHLISPTSSKVTGFKPAVLVERVWTVAPCGVTSLKSQDKFALAVERLLLDANLTERKRIFDNPDTLGELCCRKGLCSCPDFVTPAPEYVEALNDAYCLDEDWLEENLQPGTNELPGFEKMIHDFLKEGNEHEELGVDGGITKALWSTRTAFGRDGETDEELVECLYMALAYCACGDYVFARHIIHNRLEDALYESHCRRHFTKGTAPSTRNDFFGRCVHRHR